MSDYVTISANQEQSFYEQNRHFPAFESCELPSTFPTILIIRITGESPPLSGVHLPGCIFRVSTC